MLQNDPLHDYTMNPDSNDMVVFVISLIDLTTRNAFENVCRYVFCNRYFIFCNILSPISLIKRNYKKIP